MRSSIFSRLSDRKLNISSFEVDDGDVIGVFSSTLEVPSVGKSELVIVNHAVRECILDEEHTNVDVQAKAGELDYGLVFRDLFNVRLYVKYFFNSVHSPK